MTIKAIKELRSQYNEAITEMKSVVDGAEKDKRGLTTDEQTKWDAADQRATTLKGRIEVLQRTLDRMSELEESEGLSTRGGNAGGRSGEDRDGDEQRGQDEAEQRAYAQAFGGFVRRGMEGLSQDHRSMMLARRGIIPEADRRDLSAGTGASGGFTVPQGFFNRLTEAQRDFGGVRALAEVINTDSGNTIPMPTEDDTANAAAIVGEAVQGNTGVDATFGSTNIGAFTYRTLVKVSIELLQDSAFDIEAYVARKFGTRFERGMNAHFTTGTGTGQPTGITAASGGAATGKVGTTGQTTSIIFDDLVDLEHSVDPAYRRNAKWMWHDSSLKVIKKLKDSQGRPIWMPDYATSGANFPATIMGYGYAINQDMPVMAANAKSVAFGDFSSYKIRQVRGMLMLRLQERYADFGQVGFIAFMRADGKYLNSGNPIKLYANSAT